MAMSRYPAGEGSEILFPSQHYAVVECWRKCGTEQILAPNDVHTFTCEHAGSTFLTDVSKDEILTQQFVARSHTHTRVCAMSLDAAQKPLSSGLNRKKDIFYLIVCFSWSVSVLQTLCH